MGLKTRKIKSYVLLRDYFLGQIMAEMATLITAALTVIGFIIGQVSEGQYKWDEDISLEYTSGFMTGNTA